MCDKPGRPVAVEVFAGELHDDKTLPSQIEKLKARFGLSRVVVVSDRGMVTKANIELLAATEGVGWITALKAPQVKKLVSDGELQLSLFDQHNLAEITSEDYPGERLIVCRNPLVAAERARKREELLQATERGLAEIAERVERGTLTGADQIGLAVGPALKRYRVKKHFEIADHRHHLHLHPQDRPDRRPRRHSTGSTSCAPASPTPSSRPPRSCAPTRQLEQVERAFRTFKGPELEIRPIHHHLEDRVRAHVFLCMLAYYLTWHLRHAWAPLLFKDETPTHPARPRRQSHPLTRRPAQSPDQAHPHRRALPQLQEPARRARDPDPQHDPPPRHQRDLRQARPTHRAPSPRTRPRRARPLDHVVTTHPPPNRAKPSATGQTPTRTGGTSG